VVQESPFMFYFRALSLLLYHKSEDSCTFYCPKLLNFQGSQHIFNVRKLSYLLKPVEE